MTHDEHDNDASDHDPLAAALDRIEELESSPLLTVRDVATQLNCSEPLIYKLIRQGSLPAIRISESPRPALRIHITALENYLDRVNS